jgi:hypothetical protein
MEVRLRKPFQSLDVPQNLFGMVAALAFIFRSDISYFKPRYIFDLDKTFYICVDIQNRAQLNYPKSVTPAAANYKNSSGVN